MELTTCNNMVVGEISLVKAVVCCKKVGSPHALVEAVICSNFLEALHALVEKVANYSGIGGYSSCFGG